MGARMVLSCNKSFSIRVVHSMCVCAYCGCVSSRSIRLRSYSFWQHTTKNIALSHFNNHFIGNMCVCSALSTHNHSCTQIVRPTHYCERAQKAYMSIFKMCSFSFTDSTCSIHTRYKNTRIHIYTQSGQMEFRTIYTMVV